MSLNNKGFTLIELLVALALLVILSGALYGTYFSVVSAREHGGARSEERRELSSTLGLMRNEIASSFFTLTPQTTTPANGNNTNPGQNLQFVVEDRDSFGKPASLLQFTAIVPPRVGAPPSSDVEAVRYSVTEKEGTLTLVREAKDLYLQVKSAPYAVIDNIESFQVECYDGNKWVKTWDTSFNRRLPDCVRATVTLKGGENFSVVATPGMSRKSVGLSSLGDILSKIKVPKAAP
jgi:general secretion pathway protein J